MTGLAAAILSWPASGAAATFSDVGGDGGAATVTGSTASTTSKPTDTCTAPQGTQANPADPDTFDIATTSGSCTVTISGSGTSVDAAGAVGSCTPTSSSDSQTLDLPSMWIATSPPAPIDNGAPGGIVGFPTYAWITGYRGGTVTGPVATISYTTCILDTSTTPATIRSQQITHTAYAWYSVGAPTWDWDWGDAPCGDCSGSGWGLPNSAAVAHTYQQSSLGKRDVPSKGPSYIIKADMSLTVGYTMDGVPVSTDSRPDSRYRVFPVREVQSLLVAPTPTP